MNKNILLVLFTIILTLTGCAVKNEISEAPGLEKKEVEDLQNAIRTGDGDNVKNILGGIAERKANEKLEDFEKKDSIYVPDFFPEEFIYQSTRAKVVSAEKVADDEIMRGLNIVIETTDDLAVVKNFYDDVTKSSVSWNLVGNNNSEDFSTYDLKTSAQHYDAQNVFEKFSITIGRSKYEKITSIFINYFGYKPEAY